MTFSKRNVLALQLYDCGAVRDETHPEAVEHQGERGFILKMHEKQPDAPPSPYFLMFRTADNPGKPGPLNAEHVRMCAQQMHLTAAEAGLKYDHICGLPNAGEPFADAYPSRNPATNSEIGKIRLQKETVEGQRRIVGPVTGTFLPGQTVLILDDVITGADTKLEGIKVLEEAGLVVNDILVIVNRQQGGADELAKAGKRLHAIFTTRELLDILVDNKRMPPDRRDKIVAYIESQ